MAPNKKPQKQEKRNGNNGSNDVPEGYEAASADVAAWAVKEEGNIVEGGLLGRFTRGQGSKMRAFYQIRLIKPCRAVQGRGDDAEEITLDKGDIVSVDETSSLKQILKPLTEDGGKYQVWIKFIEKIELEGGNSFWKIKVAKKVVSAPTRAPLPTDTESDDIPF